MSDSTQTVILMCQIVTLENSIWNFILIFHFYIFERGFHTHDDNFEFNRANWLDGKLLYAHSKELTRVRKGITEPHFLKKNKV